ncbi:serine hydrolase-domain-containing protein [Hypoxylon rubiginosum]|uniref:Serine hydrolase-domain-containing protein n=1 Tax=Hypoxylon rubiginosum TaxID=110542 RepID=A0ACC0CVI8_9PEZI|nr:serine hydrolase-domain-containing protein [Hypoxylon rubiginosum]
MKILCLHGDDQNAKKFQSELATFLSKLKELDVDLSFDFIDVPRHKFYETGDVKDVRTAHEWLEKKLDHENPYDGVLAFSQSAALVSSFLLYRQWYDHELPPPFRFAIWISGNVPLEVLKDLGVPVSKEADGVVAQARLQRGQGLGPSPAHTAKARRAVWNSDDCFGLNLNRLPLELKIRIPTVHVWGEKDPMFPGSVHLAGLCDPYIKKIHVHQGAHEVPRDGKDVTELASLVEWSIHRATWPGQTQL